LNYRKKPVGQLIPNYIKYFMGLALVIMMLFLYIFPMFVFSSSADFLRSINPITQPPKVSLSLEVTSDEARYTTNYNLFETNLLYS
jgi:hypothetical protein